MKKNLETVVPKSKQKIPHSSHIYERESYILMFSLSFLIPHASHSIGKENPTCIPHLYSSIVLTIFQYSTNPDVNPDSVLDWQC